VKTLNVSLFVFILILAFVSPEGSGFAQSGDGRTQSTAQYRIVLAIGPAATLPRTERPGIASEGEAPRSMSGMPTPVLAMTDRGRPANRRLEVTVYDKATGVRVRRATPRIAITDRKTGSAMELAAVTAMTDVMEGQGDAHFGENVHLADGTYRIVVSVGDERAVFRKVAVGAL
jgi:hypothetical protein